MNWIKITKANLAKYQAGDYVDSFESLALMNGQENPVDDTIASTVLKIRMAIKSGGYAVDIDESKIPAELENDALALIVGICKPRITLDLTETEARALSDAKDLLMRIASGKYAVSTPDNPEPASASVQSNGGVALVRPARGTPQRSDYNGL